VCVRVYVCVGVCRLVRTLLVFCPRLPKNRMYSMQFSTMQHRTWPNTPKNNLLLHTGQMLRPICQGAKPAKSAFLKNYESYCAMVLRTSIFSMVNETGSPELCELLMQKGKVTLVTPLVFRFLAALGSTESLVLIKYPPVHYVIRR
jgi:hypothetical protein